ncbi:MAG: hypothetical protein JWQ68_287, partial [Cryobacterium sp.]|nr:hypothetical protein [Cryobacterium sp.]
HIAPVVKQLLGPYGNHVRLLVLVRASVLLVVPFLRS